MNISYAWLKSMLPGIRETPQQIADMLAMQGAPVDEITDIGGPLRDIRIARVVEAGRHPNADRLSLCTVDAGTGEMHQVVCGAPNVRSGGVYPFAPVGAHLPGDIVIKKSKIRGMESQGMLCSARELGLGKDHDGIMELPEDTPIGGSFIDVMALDDARIVVDVTPNRPDLLSHLGIAREIGASVGIEPQLPPFASGDVGHTAQQAVAVEIRDPELCPRYKALVIRGVKVGPSPAWLSGRLRAIGSRPISNVVDATNYILHELGQPLHAFDLNKLGNHIVVRRAKTGEPITTLDGIERKLQDPMLVIADSAKPVAVAGVMGGANTEVDETTTDIVLECALFQPASVRATRRALGLSTDASYRFERGVDPDMMNTAIRRAADLIVATAGGHIDGDVIEAGSAHTTPRSITLRLARVEQVLGVAFDTQRVTALLSPLGFDVTNSKDGTISVRVPGHRSYDVSREEDLIEEIARRHGYDNFPSDLRAFRPTSVPDDAGARIEDRIRDMLIAFGMNESRTLAFAPESDGDVALLLPLSSAEGVLRNALTPALLRRTEFNFSRGQRNVRLFEISTAFHKTGDALPREERRVAAVVTGGRTPAHWTGESAPFDLWDIKGLALTLGQALHLNVEPAQEGTQTPAWADSRNAWTLNTNDGKPVGIAARVADSAIDAPAWADKVYAIEIDLSHAIAAAGAAMDVAFKAIPAYPGVERDLALLVPHEVTSAQVLSTVTQSAGPLLETAFPFDVYRGKGIDSAMRSVALRLRFRAADRTLTDEEVEKAVARVLNRLKEDHGIHRRV